MKAIPRFLPWLLALCLLAALPLRGTAECTRPAVVVGPIQALHPNLPGLSVQGKVFAVGEQTEIVGMQGNLLRFADLAPGDTVEVSFCPVNSTTTTRPPVATRILVMDTTLPPPAPPICGRITALDPAGRTLSIAGTSILVSPETKYFDAVGRAIAFDDLEVDAKACVTLARSMLTVLIAAEVRLLPENIILEGRIDGISATERVIAVAGKRVRVTDQTIISAAPPENTRPFVDAPQVLLTFEDLEVGQLVRVEAVMRSGALPVALAIHVRPSLPPLVVLEGRVGAVSPEHRAFFVAERRVFTDEHTVQRFRDGSPATFADIVVGLHVRAEAVEQAAENGTVRLMARRVTLSRENDPNRIAGLIVAIDPQAQSFQAAGRDVWTHRGTVLRTHDGVRLTFADLAVGQFVEVTGQPVPTFAPTERPILSADEVVVRRPVVAPRIVEGPIFALHPERRVLVVNGIPIQTTNATIYVAGTTDRAIGFDDLRVGDLVSVEVEAALQPTETNTGPSLLLRAVKVTLLKRAELPGPPVTLRGAIERLDADSRTLVVDGSRVLVGEQTIIFTKDGSEPATDTTNLGIAGTRLTFEDLAVGMKVLVEGRLTANDSIAARLIAVLPDEPACIRGTVEGRIAELLPVIMIYPPIYAFQVGDKVVVADQHTVVKESDGRIIRPIDLTVDDPIRAAGCLDERGTLKASLIVRQVAGVLPPPPSPCVIDTFFVGPVDSVAAGGSSLVVDGVEVRLSSATRVLDAAGAPLAVADIVPGSIVRVDGKLLTLRVVAACTIRVLPERPDGVRPNRVRGPVVEIDAEARALLVDDTRVETTNTTRIVTRRGAELAFEDLRVGMLVDAVGRFSGANVLVAEAIRVQEETLPNLAVAMAHGFVRAVSDAGLTVGDDAVRLTTDTRIRGFRGEEATVADLVVGTFVHVRGTRAEDGALDARAVQVHYPVVHALDPANATFTANRTVFSTTSTTDFRDAEGNALTYADLTLGDLVSIRAEAVADSLVALAVVRHATVRAQPPNDLFDAARNFIDREGRPHVSVPRPGNSFGSVELPRDAFLAEPNTLHEVRARIASNLTDPAGVPVMRLRTNLASHERATEFVVTSIGPRQFAPLADGRDFLAFVSFPVESDQQALDARRWYPSLDLLSFGPDDVADAAFRLENIEVRPVAADRVHVVRTLLADRFAGGSNGWMFVANPTLFTPPRAHVGEQGTLELVAADTWCFGSWIKETGVALEAGRLYRARFFVRAASSDPTRVATFRLRLNSSDYQLASLTVVESVGAASESPAGTLRVYDVYLAAPEDLAPGVTLQAAFDLLNFAPGKDLQSPIALEQMQLEEILLLP
ncbi:MAG: hypothetical protein KF858_01215 [Candidatus Sumerlaeia bacterium]|nr:hypothetical protein [Candidatus Sumerlaeia bacterium]